MASGLTDLIVVNRITQWGQQTLQGTSDLLMNWTINGPGMLSCTIPRRDLEAQGFTTANLRGRWVFFKHPTAGDWGGVLNGGSGTDEIVTITAESWIGTYRGKTTNQGGGAYPEGPNQTISAGVLALSEHMGRDNLTAIPYPAIVSLSPNPGYPDSLIPRDIDSLDALGNVATWLQSASSQDLELSGYWVDPTTRQLHVKSSLGVRRTGFTVADREHINSSTWTGGEGEVFTTLTLMAHITKTEKYWVQPIAAKCSKQGVPKKKCKTPLKWVPAIKGHEATRTTQYLNSVVTVEDPVLRARYGTRNLFLDERNRGVSAYSSLDEMKTAASYKLLYFYTVKSQVSIVIADTPTSPTDPQSIWAKFRETDIIPISLGNSGKAGIMAVQERSLNVGASLMTIAGPAEIGR